MLAEAIEHWVEVLVSVVQVSPEVFFVVVLRLAGLEIVTESENYYAIPHLDYQDCVQKSLKVSFP
jgi:hypothetical protein